MKRLKFLTKFILLFLFSTAALHSQTAGNSGMAFLKYGFGARNIALGDAGNSFSNDLTGLFYNPAKLALTDRSEVMFMHNEWIQDTRSEVIGVKTDLWSIPVAFGFNVTTVDGIEAREIASEVPDTKFQYNYFYGSISSGFDITEQIFFGASIKYLYEGVLNDEANGYGVDFGIHYLLPYKGLTASAVIKNIGSMDALRNESTKLPSEFRIGAAYTYRPEESDFDFTAGTELLKYLDTEDNHFNFGGEVVYKELIAVRAGYQTGFESRGLTTGLGIKWGNLKLDYAFLPFNQGLGSANLFSLQFKF